MAAAQPFLTRPEGQISRNSLRETDAIQRCIASHAVPPLCRSSERCQKGPPTAAFAFGRRSPDSQFAFLAGHIAESLRPFL